MDPQHICTTEPSTSIYFSCFDCIWWVYYSKYAQLRTWNYVMVTWNYVIIFLYFYTFNSTCIQISTMLFLLSPYFIIISQCSRVYPLNGIALCTYSCFIALVIADKCRGGEGIIRWHGGWSKATASISTKAERKALPIPGGNPPLQTKIPWQLAKTARGFSLIFN